MIKAAASRRLPVKGVACRGAPLSGRWRVAGLAVLVAHVAAVRRRACTCGNSGRAELQGSRRLSGCLDMHEQDVHGLHHPEPRSEAAAHGQSLLGTLCWARCAGPGYLTCRGGAFGYCHFYSLQAGRGLTD